MGNVRCLAWRLWQAGGQAPPPPPAHLLQQRKPLARRHVVPQHQLHQHLMCRETRQVLWRQRDHHQSAAAALRRRRGVAAVGGRHVELVAQRGRASGRRATALARGRHEVQALGGALGPALDADEAGGRRVVRGGQAAGGQRSGAGRCWPPRSPTWLISTKRASRSALLPWLRREEVGEERRACAARASNAASTSPVSGAPSSAHSHCIVVPVAEEGVVTARVDVTFAQAGCRGLGTSRSPHSVPMLHLLAGVQVFIGAELQQRSCSAQCSRQARHRERWIRWRAGLRRPQLNVSPPA